MRRFGHLAGRREERWDEPFLAALYLAARPDLGALPVPASVIDGIARHQRALRDDDYARRYPQAARWVIEDAGKPVAWLMLAEQEEGLRVVELAVAPDARRRGVASTLLRALHDEARPLALRVRRENAAARALYVRLGFTLRREAAPEEAAPDEAALELRWE